MTKTHNDLDAILQLLQEVCCISCSIYSFKGLWEVQGLIVGALENKMWTSEQYVTKVY